MQCAADETGNVHEASALAPRGPMPDDDPEDDPGSDIDEPELMVEDNPDPDDEEPVPDEGEPVSPPTPPRVFPPHPPTMDTAPTKIIASAPVRIADLR